MRTIRTLMVFLITGHSGRTIRTDWNQGRDRSAYTARVRAADLSRRWLPLDPGYWAYDDSISDYYWVPGTWVQAPEVGFLWTPGYWGWGEGGYFFNEGYWGETVGFYGGISYGFGYYGEGYGGGRWDHGHFFYNRSESHMDEAIDSQCLRRKS